MSEQNPLDSASFKSARLLRASVEASETTDSTAANEETAELTLGIPGMRVGQDHEREITHLQMDVSAGVTTSIGHASATYRVSFVTPGLFDVEKASGALSEFVERQAVPHAIPMLREVIFSLTQKSFPSGGISIPILDHEDIDLQISDIKEIDP